MRWRRGEPFPTQLSPHAQGSLPSSAESVGKSSRGQQDPLARGGTGEASWRVRSQGMTPTLPSGTGFTRGLSQRWAWARSQRAGLCLSAPPAQHQMRRVKGTGSFLPFPCHTSIREGWCVQETQALKGPVESHGQGDLQSTQRKQKNSSIDKGDSSGPSALLRSSHEKGNE